MFSMCANPDCRKPFSYGEGQFFRFPLRCDPGLETQNTHCVHHLWLCGECGKQFTLESKEGAGVVIKDRLDIVSRTETLRCIAAV